MPYGRDMCAVACKTGIRDKDIVARVQSALGGSHAKFDGGSLS